MFECPNVLTWVVMLDVVCPQESRGELNVIPRPGTMETAPSAPPGPGGVEMGPPPPTAADLATGVSAAAAAVSPAAVAAPTLATAVAGSTTTVDEQTAMLNFLRSEGRQLCQVSLCLCQNVHNVSSYIPCEPVH